MKIVIAPDSYKESLSAIEVAEAIETGFKRVFPDWQYVKCPVADGGEGSVEALVDASGGHLVKTQVVGPLGEPHQAFYGISGDKKTAFIEMAAASGIELVPVEQRNPYTATSYGTGQLIEHALEQGIRHLILCIGGSATNDAGCGMMQALGVSFKDAQGNELPYGGLALKSLENIDVTGLDPRLSECLIEVACDVTNPLTGTNGASYVYGPQKGATPEMVVRLDAALANFAEVVERDLNKQVNDIPGAGAAGGMGAAFCGFLNAELRPGIDIMTQAVGLEAIVQDADLVITGEGRLDSQSVNGKVPVGVAKVAKRYNLPVIAIAGALADDVEEVYSHGIDAAFDTVYKITTFDEIVAQAKTNVIRSSFNIAVALKLGQQLRPSE
ncbi:Belongs to the glycerate kinase type-1 family [Vibrio sp. B1FLJ16]|uniref:glycerate kinase n=1 Tax=Vibrio sp. B1FLJ16 TaxID=2751178 RepID=UPI0015F785FF|nr:glycerate kinase [Vibrio sp. B1FLJ16]CAD7819039.1 Belongs to the glycerate kinase type-1 family [Vibrio sp. B1FLJ16]CAE6937131.1 Belongs to the glycerate kinase type-1 family [Vibrio sp. B1FLJ16]